FSYDFLQPLMRKNRVSSSRPSVRWGSVGVTLRDHEHEKPHLLRDMQEQLCPRIGEPLEFESAYKACKKSVFSERGPTSPQLVTLAAMEAYKGDEKTARDTIRKARANINSIPTDRFAKCDQERLDYLDALERWLDEGTARQHLDEIVAAEKRRYGIEDTE
ncbi:MAG: hypothetical protein L6Q71_10830, partial [Planctomycetes bacterium]|nr:hypothetical protein [Planctomycetota bacterium]